jgi:hypothetical protein
MEVETKPVEVSALPVAVPVPAPAVSSTPENGHPAPGDTAPAATEPPKLVSRDELYPKVKELVKGVDVETVTVKVFINVHIHFSNF